MMFIIIIFIAAVGNAFTQGNDNFKLLFKTSEFINMSFTDTDKGYIYGKEISYKYFNGKWIWMPGIINPKDPMYIDQTYGYAIQDDSVNNLSYYYSQNGGESWGTRWLTYFPNTHFEDIMYTNRFTGWIVGSELNNYFIIKTTNGASWTKQTTIPSPKITSIYMIDSLKGFSTPYHQSESSNYILKTTNGGANWDPVYLNTISRIVNINFIDDLHGWLFSDGSKSMRTTDGGISWIQANVPTPVKSVFFLNSLTGWFGSTLGNIYKTTTGGANWTSQGVIGSKIKSIYFSDDNLGWACISSGSLVKTTNGGTNWYNEIYPFPYKINSGATPNGREFYVNANNILYRMDNYGQKNTQLIAPGPIKGIEAFDQSSVYLLSNKFFRSTDKGSNWDTSNVVVSNCMDFPSRDTGYIGGTGWGGKVLKTTNGGDNWIMHTLEKDTTFNNYQITNIHFLNSNTGFIATYYCRFFKTTNGGLSWNQLNINSSHNGDYRIASITPYDENNIFVYLWGSTTHAQYTWYHGEFLKSSNGGSSWNSVSYNSNLSGPPSFRKMHFIDINKGYLWTGSDLAKTNDGGLNYSMMQYSGGLLSNYYFKDNGDGWLFGLNGLILTNVDQNVGINNISFETPTSHHLHQNYPNPFNPSTKIKFDIPKGSLVKLKIYDMLGREVAVLVNEKLNPGSYEYEWNGINLPSGVYFYKIEAENFIETKRMVLVK